MTPDEFFDKEHGTTRALQRRPMSDSARNEWLSQFDGADHADDCDCHSCELARDEEDV